MVKNCAVTNTFIIISSYTGSHIGSMTYFIIFYFRMNIVLNLCLIASVSCFNTGYNDQSVSNILNKPECQIAHQSLLSTLALVSKNHFHRIYKFIIDHTMVQLRKTPSEKLLLSSPWVHSENGLEKVKGVFHKCTNVHSSLVHQDLWNKVSKFHVNYKIRCYITR